MGGGVNDSGEHGSDPPPSDKRADEMESQPSAAHGDAAIASVVQRWRREDFEKRGGLILRGLQLFFSLLSFALMASNRHGDWLNFDRYEEYRYLLAISILVFLYALVQTVRLISRSSGRRDFLPEREATLFDFAGDQVSAYLLISALSAAIPMTNRMREGADNLFTDTSSASISMAFFAFLSIAVSALISGYKLCHHNYV